MFKLLTNKLIAKVRGEYNARRLAIATTLLLIALIAFALSLTPSIILVQSKAGAASVALQSAEKTKISSERDTLEAWAFVVRRDLALLATGTNPDKPYELFAQVLEEKLADIKITGLHWQKDDKTGVSLKVRGVAKDRQTLLLFQNNLKNSGHWSRADFPVDNLAKETNIEFEVSLSPQKQ